MDNKWYNICEELLGNNQMIYVHFVGIERPVRIMHNAEIVLHYDVILIREISGSIVYLNPNKIAYISSSNT